MPQLGGKRKPQMASSMKHQVKKRPSLLKGVDFGYGDLMEKDQTERGAPVSDDAGPLESKAGGVVKSRADLEAERRRGRAGEKLRENLARRKQQVRARRAGQADETDGLPAAKMDES